MDIIEVASRYLDALISHDAESVPLTTDARRINNGRISVEGADALRAVIRREPVARTSGMRWLVDGDQAIVFYDLDADLGQGKKWIPAVIGERFQIRNDLIEEIEVVYAIAPDEPRPARATRYPTGTDTRETVLAAAKAYVESLVSHDASAVPLDTDVWRIENGRATGDGAAALRSSLESKVMQAVQEISDERWFASGDGAVVFYVLRAQAGDSDLFMRIAERFRVVAGQLVEIEAVFAPLAGPS